MEKQETKQCSLCKQDLTLDTFYTYPKTGRPWAYCKKCHYQKFTKPLKLKWDEKNPERKKEINKKAGKKWVKNNPDKWAAVQRRHYLKKKQQQNGNTNMQQM